MTLKWDLEAFETSLGAAARRNMERRLKIMRFQIRVWPRIFPWMRHPFLQFITSFWVGLFDEGPYSLLKPRWGGLTFGWLNDGWPTLWHTIRSLTHDQSDPYTGIYVGGAPHSLEEAQEWEVKYRTLRRLE